ncbi:MAG: DUF5666 domain-containing protein [Gammaproteobacteria bacterium]
MNLRVSFNCFVATLLCALLSLPSQAKGPELKFTSLVTAVTQTDQESGTVGISIQGLELPIEVNGDTEIEYLGEEVGIAGISVGDLIKVESFFSDEGIAAEEITVLQTGFQQFRLRGEITALDSVGEAIFFTVTGVEIRADASTLVVPRSNSAIADLSGLQTGDDISVNGRLEEGILQARQIHTGDRQHGDIEFDGILLGISGTSASIEILTGLVLDVEIDGDTSLRGNPTAGDFVEFEGRFNATLNLIAHKIAADRDGDDDVSSDDGNNSDDIELGMEIPLQATNSSLSGKAEIRYRDRSGSIDQKLEVEMEDSAPGVLYSILVYFDGPGIEFGNLTTDQFGEARAEFEVDDNVTGIDLALLLPSGKTVLDISLVEILLGEIVVLEGVFNDQSDVGTGSTQDNTGNGANDDGTTTNTPVDIETSAILSSTGSGVHGEADIRFRNDEGTIDQKFQVEIEDAPAATTYTILVFFGTESVDFGSLVTNSLGEAEAEFEVDDNISDRPLAPLLPEGKSVLDISSVQILQGDTIVAQGSF